MLFRTIRNNIKLAQIKLEMHLVRQQLKKDKRTTK